MKKIVNPGSCLELEGSFELSASLAEVELRGYQNAEPMYWWRGMEVIDRESKERVGLAGLLRSFLEDPEEKITGPIRIIIVPA